VIDIRIPLALIVSVTLAGCSAQPVAREATPAAGDATASSSSTQTAAPAAAGEAAATRTVTGTVVETMDAANYTYVLLDTGTEKIWAASSTFTVAVGDRLVVPLETPMANFHSQTLNRDFPLIYFASSVSRDGQPVPAASPHGGGSGQPAMTRSSGHPPMGQAATVTEKIAPAPGGTTIADIWANRKALAGKPVTVRGKVVRFNGAILDRNWIHLQDGSGKADEGTNDLLVTTSATAKVGDVITATGTVLVDKDFGAGYAYAVLIDNATIQPK
jgi:hypothetical protein